MEQVTKRFEELKLEAKERGYILNPDHEIVMSLVQGLVANKMRYGEEFCPCRLIKGPVEDSLDIICPCDYREADLNEYGSCFCGLYVSEELMKQGGPKSQTPERRPSLDERRKEKPDPAGLKVTSLSYPVWRCKVCGYLCANTQAPLVCPICKAKKERFEKFI